MQILTAVGQTIVADGSSTIPVLDPRREEEWRSLACETKLGQGGLLWGLDLENQGESVVGCWIFREIYGAPSTLDQPLSSITEGETEAQAGRSKAEAYTACQE